MSTDTPATEPTPSESRGMWIKSIGIGVGLFVLMAVLVLPAVNESSPPSARDSNLFGVTFQLVVTAICVAGWFGCFLYFGKNWGDPEH